MVWIQGWESWNDLNICKTMLISLNAMELRVTVDYHSGKCCGYKTKQVRNVYIGRYAGVKVCDECIKREQEFIDYLKKLPAEPPPEPDESTVRAKRSNAPMLKRAKSVNKKLELMLETRADKEARKARLIRETLEKLGQGRLF